MLFPSLLRCQPIFSSSMFWRLHMLGKYTFFEREIGFLYMPHRRLSLPCTTIRLWSGNSRIPYSRRRNFNWLSSYWTFALLRMFICVSHDFSLTCQARYSWKSKLLEKSDHRRWGCCCCCCCYCGTCCCCCCFIEDVLLHFQGNKDLKIVLGYLRVSEQI